MIFKTQRLILRPWREDDAEILYKYASDPSVGPSAGWAVHTSIENSRQIIRDVLSDEGTFALVLRETGDPVGSIGYFRTNAVAESGDMEIGYWLGTPYWGRGLVPEAVKELLRYLFTVRPDTHKVWCAHFAGNEKSRRVIQKCGFKPEFFKEEYWPGIHCHKLCHYYSMRKEEYFNKYGENT